GTMSSNCLGCLGVEDLISTGACADAGAAKASAIAVAASIPLAVMDFMTSSWQTARAQARYSPERPALLPYARTAPNVARSWQLLLAPTGDRPCWPSLPPVLVVS